MHSFLYFYASLHKLLYIHPHKHIYWGRSTVSSSIIVLTICYLFHKTTCPYLGRSTVISLIGLTIRYLSHIHTSLFLGQVNSELVNHRSHYSLPVSNTQITWGRSTAISFIVLTLRYLSQIHKLPGAGRQRFHHLVSLFATCLTYTHLCTWGRSTVSSSIIGHIVRYLYCAFPYLGQVEGELVSGQRRTRLFHKVLELGQAVKLGVKHVC